MGMIGWREGMCTRSGPARARIESATPNYAPAIRGSLMSHSSVSFLVSCLLMAACAGSPPTTAATGDALQRLADYIEVDTTNPPGNESRGVAFFAARERM